MSGAFAIALFVVVVLGVVIVWLFPEETEALITALLFLRRVVFGIGFILLALFLLYTGAASLMIIGGLLLLLAVLYLLHDPDDIFGTALPWE